MPADETSPPEGAARALSSEADQTSRRESATKQKLRAFERSNLIGERSRRWLEHGLFSLAVALLTAALWVMLDRDRPADAIGISSADLAEALPRWSHVPPPQAHLLLEAPPDGVKRDWLKALQRTGTEVSWEAAPGVVLRPMGVAAEPLTDPRQSFRVWAATQDGPSEIFDLSGSLVSLPSGSGVAHLRSLAGAAILRGEGGAASALPRDLLELKPVLLLGRASWEARFLTAALEEHGWKLDARLQISPDQIIGETPRATRPDGKAPVVSAGRGGGPRGGGPGPGGPPTSDEAPTESPPAPREATAVDLDHYAAVILLDESAAPHAAAIVAFVEAGGGAMILASGETIPELRDLSPAAASGPVQEARSFSAEATPSGPRDLLELRPLLRLREGAHDLERRGEHVAVAIRRHGKGRVIQSGYADLWRWRMASPDPEAPTASREWVAGLLSMVAHAARRDRSAETTALPLHDPAPLAAWRAAFGEPRGRGADDLARSSSLNRLALLFALAVLALLGQWLSRRLRGAC